MSSRPYKTTDEIFSLPNWEIALDGQGEYCVRRIGGLSRKDRVVSGRICLKEALSLVVNLNKIREVTES